VPLEIVDDYRDSAFAQAQTGLLFNLPPAPPEMEQLPAGISLCMIVKNEERFLAECLRSVREVVDEINIVDTGSTDRTVEIAREFGANVVFREWRNDFGWARNESLALATRRWTLVLDADEEVTPESLPLLRALRETPAALTGVYLRIQNVVDDVSGAGSTMTHVLARIFPTTPRIRFRNVIHESVTLDGEQHLASVTSPILVRHKGYAADVMESRAKLERNKPLLERAIREAADDSFSWFNFGISAISAGDFEGGIEALERMFAMPGPQRAFFPIGYVMLASAYADGRKDVDRGIALLDEGLERSPGHPNLIFTRAHLLTVQDRHDEAREWYERAIAAESCAAQHSMVDDEIWIWKAPLNVATTYVKEQRFDEAVPWFERALANKPESALLRRLMGSAYERAGRFYDAERVFREGAERDASDANTGLVEYVNYLMRRRRFFEAFDRVEQRRDVIGDRAYATLLSSAAQATRDERLGDPEPYALRALELVPGDGNVLALLDSLYAARGEAGKRAQLRAAELDAPLAEPADFARRSHRMLEEQRLDDALAAARAGLELAPGDAVLSFNAGLAAARLKRDDEALAHLAQVKPEDVHATAALALRAEIERRAGDLDAAFATLMRVRALPAPDEAALRHASVSLAGALLEAGRLDDAGKLATLALN
jgi:glycosyltransferase involved in cell wall biosynthesis/thioredoxin-like negative regulator of GroEL